MGCDKKTIKELLTTEFIGLKINNNLNWRKCIKYIILKLSLACFAMQHHTQKQRAENWLTLHTCFHFTVSHGVAYLGISTDSKNVFTTPPSHQKKLMAV